MSQGIANVSVGEQFEGFLLIKSADKGVASNGKPFLTIIFRDRSGEIDAKLWEVTKDDEEVFKPESVVHVHGEIRQFRGKAQLNVRQIRLATAADGIQPEDFMEKAPIPVEEMQEFMTQIIFEMHNPNIQRIIRYFIKKYENELFTYPAATKNHHEYAGGLAHHIVSMLKLGRQLTELYPDLNHDLLYAGIILHDIGKVKELSSPMSPSYTVQGKLLGHITIMVDEVQQAANELGIDGEEVMLLQHMILSHHGKAEWGSPKPPQIREAEVLHLIDLVDAKMNMMNRALEKVKPGEFSERIYPLENRSFYKPDIE
ncbi:3'-5' exoribonuclease YhaM [Piscibacillus halophilus]|uniref:3'-5' exoribonuclease YhaM n=1 Tax=Piscibacillus halophilus TaxID=571933 RepID=UPI00158F1AF9|nr:3'-5' exoribonuclease YhaM [Piscibacillus halophilus]